MTSKRLSEEHFAQVIDGAPLVSLDLVLTDRSGRALLGKRLNRPAKGYWFVAGGRVRKNERLQDALLRLVMVELGYGESLAVEALQNARFMGVYEHFYEENALDREGISTHYVALRYALELDDQQVAQINLDDQHEEHRWWTVDELLASSEEHFHTKAYFQDSR
jgi:colanic acid biosynthesis protein WcaH